MQRASAQPLPQNVQPMFFVPHTDSLRNINIPRHSMTHSLHICIYCSRDIQANRLYYAVKARAADFVMRCVSSLNSPDYSCLAV